VKRDIAKVRACTGENRGTAKKTVYREKGGEHGGSPYDLKITEKKAERKGTSTAHTKSIEGEGECGCRVEELPPYREEV